MAATDWQNVVMGQEALNSDGALRFAFGPQAYTGNYDANGNMTHRLVNNAATIMSYDAENRLVQVSGATAATFVYNGDGERVKSTVNGTTTAFIGNIFEWSGSTTSMKRYYYAGATRVAMRTGSSTLNFILGDHLGSSSVTTSSTGTSPKYQLYKPWGEVRYTSGTLPTKYTFTGQYSNVNDFGLMYYNARFYDPYLNRWVQPDSIIPDPANPQDWNRYSYVRDNPLKYTDPSGHFCYDSDKNEFSDGDCFDDMQQELLDYFVVQLESGDYTDLELMENLLNKALGLNSDSVIALRAASEIVRESTPKGFGWSYEAGSKFFYGNHTNSTFDDSGFGDLMDTETPNQIAHTIGIAYIAAFQKRAGLGLFTGVLVWGNEVGNQQSVKQTNIDRDLGYIATDLGNALVANKSETISDAVSQIESYNYAKSHTPWWQKIKWPWAK